MRGGRKARRAYACKTAAHVLQDDAAAAQKEEKMRYVRCVAGVVIGVVAAYYAGAMMNFFPFLADDLIVREVGFCTLIVCVVIALCAAWIVSELSQKDKPERKE